MHDFVVPTVVATLLAHSAGNAAVGISRLRGENRAPGVVGLCL